jgi:hypothetical protein
LFIRHFQGHDTTTIAITYVLLLLANHPTTQQEIYDEMAAVLGTPTKTPTYSDLKELSFMERCLKECLRLYPSVPFIARRLDEDITTSSGYVVPKNAMAQIHIYDLSCSWPGLSQENRQSVLQQTVLILFLFRPPIVPNTTCVDDLIN